MGICKAFFVTLVVLMVHYGATAIFTANMVLSNDEIVLKIQMCSEENKVAIINSTFFGKVYNVECKEGN